jgi:hypothetical protein
MPEYQLRDLVVGQPARRRKIRSRARRARTLMASEDALPCANGSASSGSSFRYPRAPGDRAHDRWREMLMARTRNKEPLLASTSLASVPRDRRCNSSTWNSQQAEICNGIRYPPGLGVHSAKPRNSDRAAYMNGFGRGVRQIIASSGNVPRRRALGRGPPPAARR